MALQMSVAQVDRAAVMAPQCHLHKLAEQLNVMALQMSVAQVDRAANCHGTSNVSSTS